MNTRTFDITKCKRNADGHLVAQYRNGEPAIILTTNRPKQDYPIVSMRAHGSLEFHGKDGKWSMYDGANGALDLINIPEKRTIEFWINVYPRERDTLHNSKTEADTMALPGRTECLHIVREYTEGEGL